MKRTLFFATLLLSAIALLTSSCGTSDSIKSLLLTSGSGSPSNFFNLAGQDGTIQLKVLAVYNSGKQIDVTTSSTWSVTPTGCLSSGDPTNPCGTIPQPLPPYGPDTVPINKTGLMTGIASLCTWIDPIDPSTNKPAAPPTWEYTGFYQTTASYRGFTTQPVAIGVGAAAVQSGVPGCGPS